MSGLMDAEGVRYLLMAALLVVPLLAFMSRDVRALHRSRGIWGVAAIYGVAVMRLCSWFMMVTLCIGVSIGDLKFVRVPFWKIWPFLAVAAILLLVPMRRVNRRYGLGVAIVCFLFNMGATFVWSRALDHSVLGSDYQRAGVMIPLIVLAAVGWKYSVQRGMVAGFLVLLVLGDGWRGFWWWLADVADDLVS